MGSINVKTIVGNFLNGSNKLSYSKFKLFKNCELSWFGSTFGETSSKEINQNYALPGIIIQRVFEEIINKKIYQGTNERDFNEWIRHNVYGLIKSCVFKLEDQQTKTYDFFKTKEGSEILLSIRNEYPLFKIDSGINPIFIEEEHFIKKYGFMDRYTETLIETIIKNTLVFNKTLNLNIKKTSSEIFLKNNYSGITLSGKIDFIERDYTKEDYFIFDGKMNLNNFVNDDQIIFYSYLINKEYGTLPYKSGFFSWSTQKFKPVVVLKDSLHILENDLEVYIKRVDEIKTKLLQINADYTSMDTFTTILRNNPNYVNCKFCNIKNSCKFKN